jgi:hypothetical protein
MLLLLLLLLLLVLHCGLTTAHAACLRWALPAIAAAMPAAAHTQKQSEHTTPTCALLACVGSPRDDWQQVAHTACIVDVAISHEPQICTPTFTQHQVYV